MDSRPIRLALLAAYLCGWLAAGWHGEPAPESAPCGCGPEPAFNSDCAGCEQPAGHHHHGGGHRHEHSACLSCKVFFLAAAADSEFIDRASAGLVCEPVEPPAGGIDLLFPRPARGPPA